jgi:tRNA (guanine-N7-)-methyltransferase
MTDRRDIRFYGRRKGHDLKPGRQRLYDEALPLLRLPDAIPSDLGTLFAAPVRETWLEIGFGGGEHLAHQARTHPDVGFIGCEPFINGVATMVAAIDAGTLANVRLFDDDARLLLPKLPDASLGRVFLLFPDPWPKLRHHKRRFVQTETLDQLARLLKPGGELRIASDHPSYVRWALWHVLRHPSFTWTARGPGDWRTRWTDAIPTRYEAKGLAGDKPAYLTFLRR